MISVVISTLDSEEALAHCLTALVPAAAEGIVREVLVVDGGSRDATRTVADAAGCDLEEVTGSDGARFAAGAGLALKSPWLMFLPAGSMLEPGWHAEAANFIERTERSGQAERCAAVFRLKQDAFGFGARAGEALGNLTTQLLGMPASEQGLLISRRFYASLGGHRDLTALSDLDIARRIGRGRLMLLRSAAVIPQAPARPVRQKLARFAVTALRLPPRLVRALHG